MGNAAKRAVKNIRIVQQHGLAILLINVIFIGWRLYRNRLTASWAHYASLLPTSAVYAFGYRLLKAQAEDGSELFQKGLVEYCWDMVWVTMFVQLLACYTEWAWVLYSIVRVPRACRSHMRPAATRRRPRASALTRGMLACACARACSHRQSARATAGIRFG